MLADGVIELVHLRLTLLVHGLVLAENTTQEEVQKALAGVDLLKRLTVDQLCKMKDRYRIPGVEDSALLFYQYQDWTKGKTYIRVTLTGQDGIWVPLPSDFTGPVNDHLITCATRIKENLNLPDFGFAVAK